MKVVNRLPFLSIVIIAALALSGCISAQRVANRIIKAPNQQPDHSSAVSADMSKTATPFYVKQFKVPVGPPPAKLAVAVIAPRNYEFSASQKWKKNPKTLILQWSSGDKNFGLTKAKMFKNATFKKTTEIIHDWLMKAIPNLPICQATGTVILLPGWGEPKQSVLSYALDFANHGYRVVLVDLRGQGQSTGDFFTFGAIEHHDISQVITALRQRNLIVGKLALVAVSAGARIALDTAARDKRLDAVVAIAPLANLKKTVRAFIKQNKPNISKAISKQKLSRAFAIASHEIGRSLEKANPGLWVSRIQAPVLYVAGGDDSIAPAASVKALAAKTPHARFIEIPGYPHAGMYYGVAKVGPLALKALARTMGPSPDPQCLAAPPPEDARYYDPTRYTIGPKLLSNSKHH